MASIGVFAAFSASVRGAPAANSMQRRAFLVPRLTSFSTTAGFSAARPSELQSQLREVEKQTAGIDGIKVNVAIAYGGRLEIVDAVRRFLDEEGAKGKSLDQIKQEISAEAIGRYIYTAGQPDPDLVIRTSGEQRLSGFLLWQSHQSEFYFCEAYWPDFRKVDFLRALRSYAQRERRLGR